MSLPKNSRYLFRQRLELTPRHKKGAPLQLISDDGSVDVVSVLTKAVAADKASFEISPKDVVRITKVEVNKPKGFVVLLFRRRNESISNQVLEHGKTRKLREPDRAPEEAPALSRHLFIKIEPEAGEPFVHRVILEEVPGFGWTYMIGLLRKLSRAEEYEYTDARNTTQKTYTVLKMSGVQSETVAAALAGGGMNYVELSRAPRIEGLDDEGLTPHPETMRLSVKAQHKSKVSLLTKASAWARANGWPDMRVQIESADDKTRVVQIARDADAATTLFVKSEYVTTKNELKDCSDEVNDELTAHAVKFFSDTKGWK